MQVLATKETILVERFNNHYVDIAEQSSGLKLAALGEEGRSDKSEICSIIESYKNHSNIKQISNSLKLLENKDKLCFKMVKAEYV